MTRKIQLHPNKGLPIDLPQESDMVTCVVPCNRQPWCEPLVNKIYKALLRQWIMFQLSGWLRSNMPQIRVVAVEIQQLNLARNIILIDKGWCNSRIITVMLNQKIRTIVMIRSKILEALKKLITMVFLNIILPTLNNNSQNMIINNSTSQMSTCRQPSKCRRDARLGTSNQARPGKVAWLNPPDNGPNANVISIFILGPCLCACFQSILSAIYLSECG